MTGCCDCLRRGVHEGCNTVCNAYQGLCFGFFEEPFACLTHLRNTAWDSCGWRIFACALTELGYFLLLPLYGVFLLLFSLLVLPVLPLSCCSSQEMKSRLFDPFFVPLQNAYLMVYALGKALFCANFTEPFLPPRPLTNS